MTNARQLLSDELLHEIEEAALLQNRQPGELLEEAVRKYLDELGWQAFVGRAEERNRTRGIAEEDVPRLIEEVRRENREYRR